MSGLTAEQQLARNDPTIMASDQGFAAIKKNGSGISLIPNVPTGSTGQPTPAQQPLNVPWTGPEPVLKPGGNFQGDPQALVTQLSRITNPNDRAAALRTLQLQLQAAGQPMPLVPQGATQAVPVPGGGQPILALGARRDEIEYRTNPLTGETMQLPKYLQPGQVLTPGVVQPMRSNAGAGGVAGLTEAALNDAATRLAHGDASVLQNYGRGMQGGAQLIAIRNRAAEIAQSEGRSADDQTAAGIALGGEKAGARTLGTRSANLGVAANELDKFSDIALAASGSVPRTQFVPLNRLGQIISSGTGSVEQAAFNAANESVINAFAQVAGRGVPTVATQEHARQMLNTAQTPEQYAAVIKQLKVEASAALGSTAETQSQQRSRITGSSGSPAPATSNGWSIEKVN